jgi:hypothetical protein
MKSAAESQPRRLRELKLPAIECDELEVEFPEED